MVKLVAEAIVAAVNAAQPEVVLLPQALSGAEANHVSIRARARVAAVISLALAALSAQSPAEKL